MTLKNVVRTAAALGMLAGLPLLVQAGPIEDAWRAFLDRTRGTAALAFSGVPEITAPKVSKRTDQLPLGEYQTAVFVAPGCRSCDEAVAGLKGSTAHLEVFDITRSKTAREAFQATGASGVPATIIGRYLLTGWSRKAFEEAVISDMNDMVREQSGGGGG